MSIYKKPAFRRGLVRCLVLGGWLYASFALLHPTRQTATVHVGEGFSFTGKQDRIRITTTKKTAGAVTIPYIRIPRVSP